MRKIIFTIICLFAFVVFNGCKPKQEEEKITFDEVIGWIEEQYQNQEISEDMVLPENYQEASLHWVSNNQEVISNQGKVVPLGTDVEVVLECEITINETTQKHEITVIVKGKADQMAEIKEWITAYFTTFDSSNFTLPINHPEYDCTISWESSKPLVLGIDGKVQRPYGKDETVQLSCEIQFQEKIEQMQFDVVVLQVTPGTEIEEIMKWLNANYANKVINQDIVFPTEHPTIPATLTWLSFYEDIIDNSGHYAAPILDQEIEFLCTITFDGKKEDVFVEMVAKGSGTVMDVIKEWVKKQIGSPIIYSFRFPTDYPKYQATFTWSSSNEQVITNSGEVIRPLENDATVNLTCLITYEGKTETYSFDVVVLEMAARDKCAETKKWLDETFLGFTTINQDLDLPTEYSPMQATINWSSSFSNIVDSTGKFTQPISGTNISLIAAITVGTYTLDVVYNYEVSGFTYTNKWEAVETFLNSINYKEIKTQYYQTYGNRTLNVINYGYLPFYNHNNAVIDVKILPYTYGKQRTGIIRNSTQYITVHDTGNNNNGADAEMHWKYINNLNNDPGSSSISWHFTVDEDSTVQNLPLDEVAWHAGDGSREYGTTYFNTTYQKTCITGGNRNSIGIETCVDEGSEYNNTMRNTAKLVAELLLQYDLGFDRIKQHNDFSGKDCPMAMRHANRWEEFLFLVELEYFAKVNLSGVTFVWTSLTPTILNDRGEVILKTGEEHNVTYQVAVTYDNETKIYNFSSKVTALT